MSTIYMPCILFHFTLLLLGFKFPAIGIVSPKTTTTSDILLSLALPLTYPASADQLLAST